MPTQLSILPLLFALACTGSKDTGDTQTEPVERTEYYEATAAGMWGGTNAFQSHMAARRILQPANSTINEDFIDLDNGDVFEVELNVDVENNTFTLAYADGTYEGVGTLIGEAWAWDAWESTSTHTADGSTVVSQDTRTEMGILANKIGYSAAGNEEWTMEEVLLSITKEQWEALQED